MSERSLDHAAEVKRLILAGQRDHDPRGDHFERVWSGLREAGFVEKRSSTVLSRYSLAPAAVLVVAGALVAWWPTAERTPQPEPQPAALAVLGASTDLRQGPDVPGRTNATAEVGIEQLPTLPLEHGTNLRRPSPGDQGQDRVGAPRATTVDELAQLEGTRDSLAKGQVEEALTRIAEYRRDVRRPRFATEFDVLEIEAHLNLKHLREARLLADRFLAAHPNSAYTGRVRKMVSHAEP